MAVPTAATAYGDFDIVETPNFVFPMRPGHDTTTSSPTIRNPTPHGSLAPSRHGLQRKSASALPTFSFNSSDTSGLGLDIDSAMLSPPRGHGHRRGASELVGAAAQSPFDFTPGMLSATPVKGHAHKRSAAISITELPILPSPSTERKVGFSDDVQIIPRPLSTVSTDSSGTITIGPVDGPVELDSGEDDVADDTMLASLDTEREGRWLRRGEANTGEATDDESEPVQSVKYARRTSADLERPQMAPRARSEPGHVPTRVTVTQEPDLEALFQCDPFTVSDDVLGLDLPRLDLGQISNFRPRFDDETFSPSIKIDLDAAAPIPLDKARKPSRQLHSSRTQSSFRGRAASAPLLARFEGQPTSSVQSMADVFEEDEDIADRIEIVAAEDDPRASIGDNKIHMDRLGLDIAISAASSIMTPTTYAASTFSTPDISQQYSAADAHSGTCASSMTDCKTTGSSALDVPLERSSVDVPSLTSTRSTISRKLQRLNPEDREDKRRKRSSIHSLTKLVLGGDDRTLQEGIWEAGEHTTMKSRKENRLSKLMFWKHRRPRVAQA